MFHYSLCFSKKGNVSCFSSGFAALVRLSACNSRSIQQGLTGTKHFCCTLAVGMEGKNEYLDLYLDKPWEENKLEESLSKQLPEELRIKKVSRVKVDRPPTSSEVAAALYVVDLPVDSVIVPELRQAVKRILQEETIIKLRRGRGGKNVKR